MLFNNIPVIIVLQFDYSMFETLMGVAFQSTWVVRPAYALRIEVTTSVDVSFVALLVRIERFLVRMLIWQLTTAPATKVRQSTA